MNYCDNLEGDFILVEEGKVDDPSASGVNLSGEEFELRETASDGSAVYTDGSGATEIIFIDGGSGYPVLHSVSHHGIPMAVDFGLDELVDSAVGH